MSNLLGRTQSQNDRRILPRGETVGRYAAYLEAQKAVDFLADEQFPVQHVSILGNDLKTVERVTGRLTYPRVALASAATGAWFGFFVGLVLMLFGGSDSYTSVISTMALGAVFWLLFGIITYALQRGKRDFTSTSQVVATSYDVIVDPEVARDARALLQKLPANGGQVPGSAGGYAPDPSQAPDRPAGWANPYQGGAGTPEAPAPDPADPQADPQTAERPGTVPRGQFPDLPDGRPQYGVRVDGDKEQGNNDGGNAGQNGGGSTAVGRDGQ